METVLAALISAIGLVIIALLESTRRHAKVARVQTENDHANDPKKITNLRDNIDVNHSTNLERFDTIIADQNAKFDSVLKGQGQIFDMIATLFTVTNFHTTQIDDLTHPKVKVQEIISNDE